MSKESDAHLLGLGPKRILSLDGGGTLGIIELAFLERVESLLRESRGGDPAFRLCDWFDLVGGTSTGAIIAACLSIGYSAAEVTQMYLDLAPKAFRRRRWRVPGLAPLFDATPLTLLLNDLFGDRTLESESIRTGLAMMARRFDTSSPWLISNNPRAPFWNDPPDGNFIGNRRYRLADMVRASTAAPGFFRPQLQQVIEGSDRALFIDGGLSPYNNPSLALLMLSQARAFGLQWKVGPENLILLSIGAGQYRRRLPAGAKPPFTAGGLALRALMDTVADGQLLALTLLQWFGDTPEPWPINSELGDLAGEIFGGRALLRFQRYDLPLEAAWLREHLNLHFTDRQLTAMRRIDNPAGMKEIHAIALRAAELQVKAGHFL
ncbi:patatin-like phospholipase family protein [Granulicella aggregans]|uniref:patatin-like phospholipase family protein n=1 Tax=Granulicella aggregans TaxID=474949 RepID=UPI0021E0A381|nr:patatin-like phospholipase family protein [Granulicella aggregans]